jgi:2-isopropylmalate synthase
LPEIIKIFDTTLRDGEQSPGASMTPDEKLIIAKQLAKLNIDVIEAGFPIASDGDFNAVKRIAKEVKGVTIAGLARANKADIERAYESIKYSDMPRIHTFIATSPIHIKYKLKMTPEQVIENGVNAVKFAKKLTDDVEFSAEDATRSELDFLVEIFTKAIEAGATVINIPDTVGYTVPGEYFKIISYLKENIPNIEKAVISVHCHNDLGLAVANTLAAIEAGARQVEATINGIGERAGNAACEEIVMALKTRKDFYNYDTNVSTEYIYPTSKLVSQITGITIQPNKAVVGANAFAHESGIHQDGVLKAKETYEIIKPETIGIKTDSIVLGKHSGRHALKTKLAQLGYDLSDEDFEKAFKAFKSIADKKKVVYDEDVDAIIAENILRIPHRFELKYININCGTFAKPSATVQMEVDGKIVNKASFGDGPVDAAFKVIKDITGINCKLVNFSVKSITGGTDALGEVNVRIEYQGKQASGQGADTDIIVASAKAFVNAMNKLAYRMDNWVNLK